jgi:hypothetical protein
MTSFEPQWLFAVLGPLFLALGVVRFVQARRLVPQARTWFILGVVFTAVAVWLWVVRA